MVWDQSVVGSLGPGEIIAGFLHGNISENRAKKYAMLSIANAIIGTNRRHFQAFLCFTAICSAKILFTPQKDDLKSGYTPKVTLTSVSS
jgi:hypothetical protein